MAPTRVRLIGQPMVWLVLGLAFGLGTPVRGQETPQGGAGALKSGTAVKPTVTVEHRGRLLVLNYRRAGPDGEQQANAGPPGQPPTFAIYKAQRKIASGQFVYG